MANASRGEESDTRIMLGLLDSVEQDGGQSQRRLAAELGVALGLVNAYLKRCVKKGLVKVRQAPARRYAYYLTPQGFAEKSRLTVEYFTSSFGFFREAKTDCSVLLRHAKAEGVTRVVLAGRSDLAEIAALCAMEHGIELIGMVDAEASDDRFIGLPVFPSFDAVQGEFDAVLITDLLRARETREAALARFGEKRVLVPRLLLNRISRREIRP
jgi:DNA-binding MarR family transcriptional regulator